MPAMAVPQVRVESKVYVIPGRAGPTPSGWWKKKGTVSLVLGRVWLAGGALGVASGLSVLAMDPGSAAGVTVAAFCGALGVAPGLILTIYGVMQRKHVRALEEFTAILDSYRRADPRRLAKELGVTLVEVQRLFKEASALRLTRAYIDRATGEFVLYDAADVEQFVDACPGCGAKIQRWVFPDDTFTCPYCGTDIGVAVRARRTQAPAKS